MRLTGDEPDDIIVDVDSSSFRINTLKTSAQLLTERLIKRGVSLQRVRDVPNAYSFQAPFSLGATEEYLLGLYYLQELASQFPVLALSNVFEDLGVSFADSQILDMCAAPGSKTTQLAAVMNNEGSIIALDADSSRCESLMNNLERCGVSNTHVFHKDGLFVDDLELSFDAVLLDAPCSGNFCSEKNWFSKRRMNDPKSRSSLQKDLLAAALRVLKPGGVLIYSTCSLEVEENEFVIDSVSEDDARLVDMRLPRGSAAADSFGSESFRKDMTLARRLWPHRDQTQGFFLAAFVKQ